MMLNPIGKSYLNESTKTHLSPPDLGDLGGDTQITSMNRIWYDIFKSLPPQTFASTTISDGDRTFSSPWIIN